MNGELKVIRIYVINYYFNFFMKFRSGIFKTMTKLGKMTPGLHEILANKKNYEVKTFIILKDVTRTLANILDGKVCNIS